MVIKSFASLQVLLLLINGAKKAVENNNKSLLPAGVLEIKGHLIEEMLLLFLV